MKKILLTIPFALIGCATPPVEVMPDTIDEIIPKSNLLHQEAYHAKKEPPTKEPPPVGYPGDSVVKLKKKAKKLRDYKGHGTTYTQGYYHSYDSFHRNYYYKNGISPH